MNAKAMNILHCSLEPDEFARVCSCKTAKEVWDLLQATLEGDTSTKQTMLALGNSEYESFKIGQHESIQDANRRLVFSQTFVRQYPNPNSLSRPLNASLLAPLVARPCRRRTSLPAPPLSPVPPSSSLPLQI
ncbi:hypothetical protein DM860_001061 [Cuscuta australis]|uniref:UBN2 domain-containing protein n=1 Tax=Cuscuta australis TaxID=267555 RepID=A0A328DX33_9ASTE|nr:hypothetical protein DM860_001061 [Cuscuta australis]